jgi:aryl-alcohol dehydrogenase-like predicted oxidoreductase
MADVALAWLLAKPAVTSVVVGASRPEHVARNARAVQLQLSPETIAELERASDPVRLALGTNPDMWAAETRYR